MVRFLPFIFLLSVFAIFGLIGIIWYTDPDIVSRYVFALFAALVFASTWGILGVILYFLRTRLYKRYSAKWYFYTSFKMALFVAVFAAIVSILAIFQLVSTFNILLAIFAISLFALWSYLGKKTEKDK